MINFLVGIFTAPFRVLADLGDAILNGVKTIWHGLTALGRGVRTAWNWMVAGAKAIGGILERVALDVYNGLKWLLVVQLPKWAKWAASEAAKVGGAILKAAGAFAIKLYNLARSFAVTLVNTLSAWVHDAVSWLTSTLADAWNLLHKVASLVFDLLTSPAKLAEWLAGAMARALLRFALASAEAIARFVFTNILRLMLQSANLIESIFADVVGGP